MPKPGAFHRYYQVIACTVSLDWGSFWYKNSNRFHDIPPDSLHHISECLLSIESANEGHTPHLPWHHPKYQFDHLDELFWIFLIKSTPLFKGPGPNNFAEDFEKFDCLIIISKIHNS